MLNIREGQFETNSSSTHKFFIPKEGGKINIPDSITLFRGSDNYATQEGRIRFLYQYAENYGRENDFIMYLKSKGIEIEDEEPLNIDSLCSCFGISEEELDALCFNTNTVSENNEEFSAVEDDYEHYKKVEIDGY